jgi:hypothetical protein
MNKINDLQIGKAGEYLVCADLILQGYIAFPSEQGLPFDVVLNNNGKLFKVQVKTTRQPKHIAQRKSDIPAYIFHIGINGSGKNNKKRRTKYESNQVDIFALVALDSKRIAYLPYFNTQTTMNFRVPELKGKYHDEQALPLKQRVLDLRKQGMDCLAVAEKLNLTLPTVYRYSANVSIEQRGTNAGIYFDTFPLGDCLDKLERT